MGIAGIQFQPSEIAKGSLVLAVAQILSAMQTEKGADKQAFWWVLGTSVFIVIPILLENFSTAVLISAVVFFMMFVARVPLSQLGKLLGVVIIFGVIVVSSIMAFGKSASDATPANTEHVEYAASAQKDRLEKDGEKSGGVFHRFDTWKSRIEKFTSTGEISPDEYDLDKDAQVAHANIAIVKSQGIGCGPGNSEERDFISQAFSDFIFAIIIEELGLWGGGNHSQPVCDDLLARRTYRTQLRQHLPGVSCHGHRHAPCHPGDVQHACRRGTCACHRTAAAAREQRRNVDNHQLRVHRHAPFHLKIGEETPADREGACVRNRKASCRSMLYHALSCYIMFHHDNKNNNLTQNNP